MLTAHKYQDVGSDWDKDIKDCCKATPPGQTGCTDCCYDDWQDELKTVSATYSAAQEQASQKQIEYDFLVSRRDRYKSWLVELDTADTQARDICAQLKLLAVQTDRIWYNSNKTVEAVEILYCMIREMMLSSDRLKQVCLDIDNCISKNTDSLVTGGQGFLVYYKDYKTKLDATVKARDEIMKNIVDAVVIANLIASTVSTRDVHSTTDPVFDPCNRPSSPCTPLNEIVYGFKTIICEWYNYFACDAAPCPPPGTGTKSPTQNPSQQATATPVGQSTTGAGGCELSPTFEFPICANPYRDCVQKWVDADAAKITQLAGELSDAQIRAQGLQACITSLTNAIKAVNPSDRCK
jgi:hypothetical protein